MGSLYHHIFIISYGTLHTVRHEIKKFNGMPLSTELCLPGLPLMEDPFYVKANQDEQASNKEEVGRYDKGTV